VLIGPTKTLVATASDPAPGSGVKEVRFYAQACRGGFTNCRAPVLVGADSSAPYSVVWTFPSCVQEPDEFFNLIARAEDNCGNVSADSVTPVRLSGRPGCDRREASASRASSWWSELAVPGGRAQVVLDGREALFPREGREAFPAPSGPGPHRLEATLVSAAGRPGTWRFDLSALPLVPASLRVVAGEAVQVGPDQAVFRLRGRAGERVVLAFEIAED
jgi:hypothetical protein